jgi:osmotically-inducible protein OsmY
MRKALLIAPGLILGLGLLMAQPLAADHPQSVQEEDRISNAVRHELVMLPYYGVFDNLQYQVSGNVVTLTGQVTRPVLKSDAGNAVKHVEGVTSVINHIEVLPPSPMDNRIRWAVLHAIYGRSSPLFHYGVGAQYPIHIIVNGGRVKLTGVVDNQIDVNIAMMRARVVPGTFSVTNDLQVRG